MKLPKELLILVFVAVVLVSSALYLGLKIKWDTDRKKDEISQIVVTPTPFMDEKFDETKFNNKDYVTSIVESLGSETTLAQVRGVVDSWKGNTLNVKVADKILNIAIPETIELRCMPETMTDATGKTFKTSEVYLDFTRTEIKGVQTSRNKIKELFVAGKDFTAQAKTLEAEKLEGVFLVGYGCTQ